MTGLLRWYVAPDGFDRWDEVHALLVAGFSYMEGVIDPPSSLLRLTVRDLAQQPGRWLILGRDQIIGCALGHPDGDALYLSKIAIAQEARGQGYLHGLMDAAAPLARMMGFTRLRLQTRVELVQNHKAFAAAGFREVRRTAHVGFDRPTSVAMERALR